MDILYRQHAEAIAEITDLLRQVERVKSALIEAKEAAASGRYMAGDMSNCPDRRKFSAAFQNLANAIENVISDNLGDALHEITTRPRELMERICALEDDAEIAQHRADYFQEAI